MDSKTFISIVAPLAQTDMEKTGILASLTIAQAILESGWGSSELAKNANALFGIKATSTWRGKAYSKNTKECYDGVNMTTVKALFRAYGSWAESVSDHGAFLKSNSRYKSVIGETDYKKACAAIKAAGYATDPQYADKLVFLIEEYELTAYDIHKNKEVAMNITKRTSTHNTSYKANRQIKYIVVHYTAGISSKPGNAVGTATYFAGSAREVSADYIVDDGTVVQYNPDIRNRYTWHCGGSKYKTRGGSLYGKATNANTIGIEVCSINSTGKVQSANDKSWSFSTSSVDNLVKLVRQLMADYHIDADHVIRHYDVNGKPCPGIFGWNADTGSEAQWIAFKARIGSATQSTNQPTSGTTVPSTSQSAAPYLVRIATTSLNVRKGPGTGYAVVTTVKRGEVYTIVGEKMNGSTKWGKLKSGAGWISLSYTSKV